MIEIPLRNRRGLVVAHALVDDLDADRVIARGRWHRGSHGYVTRSFTADGRKRSELLHRFLMGLSWGDPLHVDHRNLNRLDCQRQNLRVGTQALNNQNQPRINHQGSSRFRGVSWNKSHQQWEAYGQINKKRTYLGLFLDEVEAAEVASAWRAENLAFTVEKAQ